MNKMAARAKTVKREYFTLNALLINPWATVIQTPLECCLDASLPQ